MDYARLKKDVIAFSRQIEIDLIGFTTADPFMELKERLTTQKELGYESGFEEKDIVKRCHPEYILQDAKSMIAIALAYPSHMKNPPKSEPGQYRGMMARVAWGEDYHRVLQNKLKKLEDFIKERIPSANCVSMVDTGVLSDRAVAVRAGLGWIGKNTSLITEQYGSWVYLGEMITNIPFLPDSPAEGDCGDCQKCLDFCPTGALIQGGQLNAKRCLAFLTQVKETLPEDVQIAIGNRIYGCDTCQQVCPKNKGKNFTHHEEFLPDGELVKPLLLSLVTMGKKEFAMKFSHSSAAWRGKKPIQRNAILALAHFKEVTAISALIDVLHKDPRPTIREAAAWSLGRIGGAEALIGLIDGRNKEKDEEVLQQIHTSIKLLENVDN